MVACYFAYGSNMNPARVRERGLQFEALAGASLRGYRLAFNKASNLHPGVGHANLQLAPGEYVEGVLYWLAGAAEIVKMDHFERTPINYSREIVQVEVEQQLVNTWTYFANPAVRRSGLKPPRTYLDHLLAGRDYLSEPYYQALARQECDELR